jgi:peptidoglycan/LPS O-acetylase OafA/YrhL
MAEIDLSHTENESVVGGRDLSTPPAAQTLPRLGGVDTLRGLSILAVLLLHIKIRLAQAGLHPGAALPRWLSHLLFNNGNNGVTVFFAISGFLIASTSLRRFGSLEGLQPAAFYRLRFARIAPLLLLVLALLAALHVLRVPAFIIEPGRASLPRALVAALTFHLNWLEATRGWLPPAWDILWSLSIEEMFYLFFPLACLLLLRRGRWPFIALLLAFVAIGPWARSFRENNEIWQEKSYLGGMDGIALGVLCALLAARLSKRPTRVALSLLAAAGAAVLLWIAVWPRWPLMSFIGREGLDGTLLALGTCAVVLGTALGGLPRTPALAPLRWLGRHSYEVYLTHEFLVVPACALFIRLRRGPVALWVIAIVLCSAALGGLVARFFSEPLNRRLRVTG